MTLQVNIIALPINGNPIEYHRKHNYLDRGAHEIIMTRLFFDSGPIQGNKWFSFFQLRREIFSRFSWSSSIGRSRYFSSSTHDHKSGCKICIRIHSQRTNMNSTCALLANQYFLHGHILGWIRFHRVSPWEILWLAVHSVRPLQWATFSVSAQMILLVKFWPKLWFWDYFEPKLLLT